MKLYNQTKNALRWDLSMTVYTCAPYGEVEVPDMFVMSCKARGLPLDVTPVAPEVKANESLEGASEAAKKDQIFALQKSLGEAVASEKVAKIELSKALEANSELVKEKTAISVSLESFKSKYDSLIADHNALIKLSDEQTKAFEVCKVERDRAVATLEQFNKPPLPSAPVKEDKQQSKK